MYFPLSPMLTIDNLWLFIDKSMRVYFIWVCLRALKKNWLHIYQIKNEEKEPSRRVNDIVYGLYSNASQWQLLNFNQINFQQKTKNISSDSFRPLWQSFETNKHKVEHFRWEIRTFDTLTKFRDFQWVFYRFIINM